MAEKKPPDWANDPLSAFIKDAEYNERATTLNFPKVYELLGQTHALFQKSEEVTEKDNRLELLVPRILMVRSHSSFLAGIRLAMSRQVPESFPVLRCVIESAWYALHIAKDPGGTERSEIWLRRESDIKAKKKCKTEFAVANVRQTHQALDAVTAKELSGIYEDLITFGAHPNEQGVLQAVSKNKMDTYNVEIFVPNPGPVLHALRMSVATAIGALKTHQLVFPERFTIAGLDLEIKEVVLQANALFTGSTGRW